MQSDPLLYQKFPRELRHQYEEAVQASDWGNKHLLLLKFAETSLRYLASLALSDYRSHSEPPNETVEVLLERLGNRKLSLGLLFELFRTTIKATPEPLIPASGFFPEGQAEGLGRFVAAAGALDVAVAGLSRGASAAAIDVGVHVKRSSAEEIPSLDWWKGWERLVWYRNKVFHSSSSNWPLYSADYGEVMSPLLHDALVGLLTEPVVSHAVLAHPVVNLTLVEQRDEGGFGNWMSGEHEGIWFEKEIVTERPVTERWNADHWNGTAASSYVLSAGGEKWSVRALFWDLNSGLPPARAKRSASDLSQRPTASLRKPRFVAEGEGRGTAPGTCGEFAQGILPDGTPFHVTCPINKSATVIAKVRPADRLAVLGQRSQQSKLAIAVEYAVELLELGPVEVAIRHWSDLDVAKGMGSSTADVLAGIRAVADAVGEDLGVETEARLAAKVESSDGSMYPGIAAVNHKTCELLRAWSWHPEFVIVMLVPKDTVNTASITFAGQERFAEAYKDLLAGMDDAVAAQSIEEFAALSTQSAALNQEFLLNPHSRNLIERLGEFEALGVNVGHTGTVCGLLFANTEAGQVKASDAYLKVGKMFGDLKEVKVVTTPRCQAEI